MKQKFARYRTVRTNTFYMTSYTNAQGNIVGVQIGKNANGDPIMKKFSFADKQILSVSMENKKEIKHLDESPFCQGSDLNVARREKAYYMRIDQERDATNEFELQELGAKSMARALKICGDKERMGMVAVLCGATSDGEMQRKTAIMGYAKRHPAKFLELTDDKNTAPMEYEVFIKQCVANGVVQDKSGVYYFHDEKLGKGIGEVIKTLVAEPEWGKAMDMMLQQALGNAPEAPKKAIVGGNKQ